jgi:alkylhydroperoxidase family enzyme
MTLTTPKIDVAAVQPGQDTVEYLSSLTDQKLLASYLDFYLAAAELSGEDAELVELIRIRNGVAQGCKYCLSVRLDGGAHLGRDTEWAVTHLDDSDLSPRQKAALRLATAFLTVPSELDQGVRDEALEHFTPAEIVALMLRLTSFLVNKPRAALGIDLEKSPDKLTSIG